MSKLLLTKKQFIDMIDDLDQMGLVKYADMLDQLIKQNQDTIQFDVEVPEDEKQMLLEVLDGLKESLAE